MANYVAFALTCALPAVFMGLSTVAAETGESSWQPRVWMCHRDIVELGRYPDQWPFVGQNCDVITLYIDRITQADIEDLRSFAAIVKERGIAVAVECAGLCDWRARFGDTSAELSFQDEFKKVKRYLDVGGTVQYLQMDGPFRRMFYQEEKGKPTRGAFHTVESAAVQLVDVMKRWRAAVPGIEFYLLTNFPNWGYGDQPAYHSWQHTGQGSRGWGDYKVILEAALKATTNAGIPLKGITVDNPLDYATGSFRSNQPTVTHGVDWIGRILALEKQVEEAKLEFSMIFNSSQAGAKDGGSDQAYQSDTLRYISLYRERGGEPRNVIVQSWYDRPSHCLPETEATSMTGVVAEVIRQVKKPVADTP